MGQFVLKNDNDKLKDYDEEYIEYFRKINDNSYNNFLGYALIVFYSLNNILTLIYRNKFNVIIAYNLDDLKIMLKIENTHKEQIEMFSNFLDKPNKRDLFLSISRDILRVWNVLDFNCILALKNENYYKYYGKFGYAGASCFTLENNQIYICQAYKCFQRGEFPIKVLDFNGKIIKEFDKYKSSSDIPCYLDTFYDTKYSKIYIISGGIDKIKSYDFEDNKLYHIYVNTTNERYSEFHNLVVKKYGEKIKLIGYDCFSILIWDFHLGDLLDKIEWENSLFYGMCLINDYYLVMGGFKLEVFDLKSKKSIQEIEDHNQYIILVKMINHPNYGKMLFTQGRTNDIPKRSPIETWRVKI